MDTATRKEHHMMTYEQILQDMPSTDDDDLNDISIACAKFCAVFSDLADEFGDYEWSL